MPPPHSRLLRFISLPRLPLSIHSLWHGGQDVKNPPGFLTVPKNGQTVSFSVAMKREHMLRDGPVRAHGAGSFPGGAAVISSFRVYCQCRIKMFFWGQHRAWSRHELCVLSVRSHDFQLTEACLPRHLIQLLGDSTALLG